MKKTGKGRAVTLIYLIPLIIMLLIQPTGVLKNWELTLEDRLYQTGTRVDPNIYVIGIDEETLSEYGAWTNWSREKMADLINKLTEDPEYAPSVIAIDVGFFGEKDPETDDRLVEAVRNAGNVVLVSTATFGNVITEEEDGSASSSTSVVLYEEPFDALKDAAAGVGHSNTQADNDGIIRHALGRLYYEGVPYPSFAYQIYQQYTGESGSDFANSDASYYIRYADKPRAFFGAVGAGSSFKAVLEGEYPVQAFAGGIVLIGAYASGMQDHYFPSISHAKPMYGVEIHANILQQIIDGAHPIELSGTQQILITLLMGVIIILLLTLIGTRVSVPLSLLLGAGYVFAIRQVYENMNVVSPVIYAPALAAVLAIIHIAVRYFTIFREKQRVIASYGKYLSPEIAKTIADTGESNLSLGGQKKDIAVLFVDIRGFTTLSEQLAPERVVEMLNSYLKVTTSAIFKFEGTVDKFIGDATMGVFNAPLDLDDYTYRAVCAGLEMAKNSEEMRKNLSEDLRDRVGFGIGINCGDAIVGNIGTDFRMEYTAIGDTVNTASRLEGQAKAGEVIISEAVYERVKDRIECEDRGYVKLKGKADEFHIYRAICLK